MEFPPESRLRAFGVAVLLAIGLLLATRQVGGGYALHGNYRAQVDALLDGRLELTPHPEGLAHDLAWTDRGVQQVWGLGAPLWQAPFELVGRAIGVQPVPDRIALGAWLALVAYVTLRAFRRGRAATEGRVVGIGCVLLVLGLPAFVTLLRGRLGVYEEAAAYAYGAAVILLGGLVAFVRHPTSARLVLLLAFAGAVGLFRPTVWFYGAATAVIASGVWLRAMRVRGLPILVVGATLFVAGGAALYASNAQRFGGGTEFGHRLNLHSLPGNLVATRFAYPFEEAGVVEAVVELGGALFDRPEQARVKGFYARGLHRGQSERVRWREYYFSTYAWPYLPVILAGLVIGAVAWRRRGAATEGETQHLLATWAVLGAAPLVAFYLWSPSVSSRYLLDLGPAIAALLVVAWRAFARALAGRSVVAIVVLLAAWATAIVTSRVQRPKVGGGAIDRVAAATNAYAISRPTPYARVLPGAYAIDDPEVATWSDVAADFMRCEDAEGGALDCGSPLLDGDRVIRGTREGKRWSVTYGTVTSRWFDDPEWNLVDPDDAGACSFVEDLCELDTFEVIDGGRVAVPALYLNGTGWDLTTGEVPPATYFYASDVELVEVDVTGPDANVRVNLDRTPLATTGIQSIRDGVRIRFAVPSAPARGLHVIFVALGDVAHLDQPRSGYAIRRIRWR